MRERILAIGADSSVRTRVTSVINSLLAERFGFVGKIISSFTEVRRLN